VKERRGQSTLGFGGRVENSLAAGLSKMLRVSSCIQLVAFSGPFLRPLEAVFATVYTFPSPSFGKEEPLCSPLPASCTGPWQPLMMPMFEAALA